LGDSQSLGDGFSKDYQITKEWFGQPLLLMANAIEANRDLFIYIVYLWEKNAKSVKNFVCPLTLALKVSFGSFRLRSFCEK